MLHRRGKLKAAIPYYKHVVKIDKRMLEASYNLADIYFKSKELVNALTYYQIIIKQNPYFEKTLLAVAQILLAQHKPSEALPFLLKFHEKHPQELNTVQFLGYAYQKQGHFNKALHYYSQFLSQKPNDKTVQKLYKQAQNKQK